MYIPKTTRRKGIHKLPVAKIPAVPKLGGIIKTPAFPKLPKLPTTHTNKGRY
jgi:hypothetical protein